MNIVDLVTSQLTGDVLGKLGGLIGADESQTKSATGAAVPALLGILAKLSGTKSGADQLASVLGGLDLGTLGKLAGVLGGSESSGLGTLGGKLLTSLLGNNLGSIVGTVAKIAGTNPALMKTLLTYLAPVVMGVIANQFKGSKVDASGLQRLFADQQANISAAMPRGFSLADFDFSSTASRGGTGHEEPAAAFPSWIPLALIALLAAAGWWFWPKQSEPPQAKKVTEAPQASKVTPAADEQSKSEPAPPAAVVETPPAMPAGVAEALEVGKSLAGFIGDLGKTLGEVKDEGSARAMIPKIEAFSPALDAIVKSSGGLPEAGRTKLGELVVPQLDTLQKVLDVVLAIPGVREILGPVITPMVEKISKLGKE